MNTLMSYDDFKHVSALDLALVIAKTKTCVVCEPITQKLEMFLQDYPSVHAYQIYLEDIPTFSGQQLVFTVPTIIVYSNEKEILRESRFIDFDRMKRLFDIYLT